MEKCPKCGNILNKNQKFCVKCGTKIEDMKKINLSPEILAKIDILQKKISNDNLNNVLYIKLGDIYYEYEMYKEAILEYQKAFTIDNTNFDSIYKTAETYRKINNNSKAEQLYKKALEIDPKSQVAKIGLFWSFFNLENSDELFKIEKDISNDFKDINFHIALKNAYKKTENFKNEFQEMGIIYKLKSEEPDNLRDLAGYYYISDYDKSIEYYQQLFAIFPDDLEARFELGKYCCYKNEYNKTIELFDDSISSLQSDQVEIAKFYLVNSYLHINELDKAKDEISFLNFSHLKEASLKDKRIISDTYLMLCNHSLNSKKYSDALKYIQNAIEFESENEIFTKKENQIAEIWKTESKKNRKKKTKIATFIIPISVLIIAGIVWTSNVMKTNKERSIWEITQKRDTAESYSRYIVKYPEDKYNRNASKFFIKRLFQDNMILVEGGTFIMGNKYGSSNEKPAHEIVLNDFFIGKTEVTKQQWSAIMTTYQHGRVYSPMPKANFSWNDANDFIARLNKKTGDNYRLPTEAEWEFAARGGLRSKNYRYSGTNSSYDLKKIKSNELGIMGMSNMPLEWCQDLYGKQYYKDSPKNNPQGPELGKYRVLRGGEMKVDSYCNAYYADGTTTNRESDKPTSKSSRIGFRIVLDVK